MAEPEWNEAGFQWETQTQLWDFFNLDSNSLEAQIKYPMDPPPPPPLPLPGFNSDLSLNPPTLPSPDLDQPKAAAAAAAAATAAAASAGEREKGKKVIGTDEKINEKSGDDEQKKRKKSNKEGKAEANHDVHIWTERERRKKMRNMFVNLDKMIPHLSAKVDKATIVEEAVNLIKSLEKELENLEARKELKKLRESQEPITAHKLAMDSEESLLIDQPSSSNNKNMNSVPEMTNGEPVGFKVFTSPNLTLNIFGYEAQINLCSVKKPALFTEICDVLEKHEVDLISASVSSDSNRCMIMMQVICAKSDVAGSEQVEEIFKQAAGEMTILASSN